MGIPSRPTAARGWRWLSRPEWDSIAAASPVASPFHSRAWCELIARHDPRVEARALGIELSTGETAAIPVHWRRGPLRRGLLARASSVDPGVWGGPIVAGRALGEEDWRDVLDALARTGIGRFECSGHWLDPLPPSLFARVERETTTTHVLDLAALPLDLVASYAEPCRRAVRRAERAGVTCARAAAAGDAAEYYAVYQGTLARWGKSKGYPRALFDDALACEPVELWVARLASGEIAAGGLFAFSRAQCVYWQGAMEKSRSDARPMNALIHGLALEARARGIRWFDFNPSRGLEGVRAFKASFGAREVALQRWRVTRPILARARALRRSARGTGR
jgi:hypothetical protein